MTITVLRAASPDLVGMARTRRKQIAEEIGVLEDEAEELDYFLETADRLQAKMASSSVPALERPRVKASKKDVVDAALFLIRGPKKGGAVTTGEVVEALQKERWELGTEASSASSVVSANLSAAPEITRSSDGKGWIEAKRGLINSAP